MSDAPTAGRASNPGPPPDRAATGGNPPTRSGRLIGLVRRLIDYGKELAGILRQPCTAERHFDITHNFGTLNIALIMSRVARGLRIAAALESRLLRNASRLDDPPARAVAASPRQARPGPRRSAARPTPPADDDAALLAHLPTPQEIAARIRRRSIGDVLTDIFNDLGIVANHPLWRDVHEAVMLNGGSVVRMSQGLFKRLRLTNWVPPDTVMVPPVPPRPNAAAPWPSCAASTGPP